VGEYETVLAPDANIHFAEKSSDDVRSGLLDVDRS
jgi:hypothetical protein